MIRIRYFLFLIAALLMSAARGSAQEASTSLSLQQAIELALRENPDLKNARLDILIQEAKNAEVTGLARPNVSGSGQFIAYPDPVKSFIPARFFDPNAPAGAFTPVQFTPKYGTTASVSANQILFDGSVLVALQAREAILKLANQNAQLSAENVRVNVTQAYYALVVASKQFGILKNSLANARTLLRDIQIMQQTGVAEKIDLDRTSVTVNNLATDSIRINSLLAVSEQLLKYRMGIRLDQRIVLTDTAVSQTVATAQAMLQNEFDVRNRTEYKLLESQLQLNLFDLKRHRLSGLPSLAAFAGGTYTYSTNTFRDLFREQYIFISNVGLQLNVPIFDGLQRRNRVKQAQLNVEKTNNSLQYARLGFDFQAQTAKTTLRNNLLALQNQQNNADLAYSVYDLAQRKYKEGVGSNLEVTQAQTEYLQAQSNYFQALLDVANAQTDLQRALGMLR